MAEPGLRLRGQEMKVVVVQDGGKITEINSIASFNKSADLAIQDSAFLGEVTDRFDSIMNGFGGDFEMHVTTANWVYWEKAVIEKAQRINPATVFNVVVVDLFADGTSLIRTFTNVAWGAIPENVGSRQDFKKIKGTFKCSEAPTQVSAFV